MSGQVQGAQVTWTIDITDISPNVADHLILTYSGGLNGARDSIDGKWTLKSKMSGIDESGTFAARRKPSHDPRNDGTGKIEPGQ